MSELRRQRILLVEDEPAIATLVRTYLERDGHEVHCASTGREALAALATCVPALIVLDLGLPDLDGLEIARAAPAGVGVIVLTARGDEPERVAGFEAGADDYVVKPFSPRELAARVRAVLRRRPAADAEMLVAGTLVLDPASRETRLAGRSVKLTAREFDLLAHLVANAGTVVSRDALLAEVWDFAAPGQTRTVDQHVAQVRAKLGDPALVQTVRGLGYKVARA